MKNTYSIKFTYLDEMKIQRERTEKITANNIADAVDSVKEKFNVRRIKEKRQIVDGTMVQTKLF